jgi:signal transduction histidine kinase
VVQNLLDNSVKFMGSQEAPVIEVSAVPGPDGTTFAVADNGRGLAPEDAERAFELFERVDATVEGSGLGLALVKKIIEAHGGRVWIESAGAGLGTTVRFTLPRIDRAGELR